MVVRNPWDRLISCYFNKIVTGMLRKELGPPSKTTFAAFVKYVSRFPNGDIHWMPYSSRCSPSNYPYTKILKLEDPQFEHKVAGLLAEAGLAARVGHKLKVSSTNSPEAKLRSRFKMFTGNTSGTGSSELVHLVRKTFAADIALFGYSFKQYL